MKNQNLIITAITTGFTLVGLAFGAIAEIRIPAFTAYYLVTSIDYTLSLKK